MTNKAYDISKWLVTVVLPALLTLFSVIGTTLDLSYTQTVLTIGTAVITCLGTILGISSISYSKNSEK